MFEETLTLGKFGISKISRSISRVRLAARIAIPLARKGTSRRCLQGALAEIVGLDQKAELRKPCKWKCH
jgi:hypothetical protein